MTNFISIEGIHYDDFNDEFNFNVCIMQTLNIDEYNCAPETLKSFQPELQNEAEKYAMNLNFELSAFPKGSYVLISCHKTIFNFV